MDTGNLVNTLLGLSVVISVAATFIALALIDIADELRKLNDRERSKP